MMFDLTQSDIESLDPEDYSLFLAYGDTLGNPDPVQTGEGSDQSWEDEATRLIEEASREIVLERKRLRLLVHNQRATWRY